MSCSLSVFRQDRGVRRVGVEVKSVKLPARDDGEGQMLAGVKDNSATHTLVEPVMKKCH